MHRITLSLHQEDLDALDAAKALLKHNFRSLTDTRTLLLVLRAAKLTQAQLVEANQVLEREAARRAEAMKDLRKASGPQGY